MLVRRKTHQPKTNRMIASKMDVTQNTAKVRNALKTVQQDGISGSILFFFQQFL